MKPCILLCLLCSAASATAQYIQLHPNASGNLLRGRHNPVYITWPDTTGTYVLEASSGKVESRDSVFLWYGCDTRIDTVTLTAWFRKGNLRLLLEKRTIRLALPPLPDVMVAGGAHHTPAVLLKAQGGLRTFCDLEYSECFYSILEYDVMVVKAGGGEPLMGHNTGNRFSGAAAKLISNASKGDIFYFSNIKMLGSCEREVRVQKKACKFVCL